MCADIHNLAARLMADHFATAKASVSADMLAEEGGCCPKR
jgi:hypothetical protein